MGARGIRIGKMILWAEFFGLDFRVANCPIHHVLIKLMKMLKSLKFKKDLI